MIEYKKLVLPMGFADEQEEEEEDCSDFGC